MGQAFANFLQAYSGPRRPGYFARNRKVIQRGTSHGAPARHQHRFSAARQALRMYRKLAGLLAAGLMAGAAAVTSAAPASAGTVAPYYRVGMAPQGGAFSLCLQGNLGGPLGSAVTQQNCNPDLADASQLWLPIALGGNIYKFQNIGTGRCLEARNGAVNGGAVDLWDCSSGESNERWYWPPSAAGGGSFTPGLNPIQTRVSGSTGFCLDIPDAQATPGLQLQTWRCNGTRAQLFWVLQ